jgi:hypothetical protein
VEILIMPYFNLYPRFASVSLAAAGAAVTFALLAVPAAQAQPRQPGNPVPPPVMAPSPVVPPPSHRHDPGHGRPDRRGPVVRCESNNGRYKECRTPFRGPVVLVQQLSDARCVPGRTYGTTQAGRIWVNRGCRGEFAPH